MFRTIMKIVGRFFVIGVIFAVFFGAFGLLAIKHIYYGASPAARDLVVSSVMETMQGRFLARWFMSDEQITYILSGQDKLDFTPDSPETEDEDIPVIEIVTEIPPETKADVILEDIKGSTYKGKILIVSDPSRVSVLTSYPFEENGRGEKLLDMAKQSGSLAAINGGAFLDRGGDMPMGITISHGELLFGEPDTEYNIIGFDSDNVFIVGRMTAQAALNAGIRDAVSFSPILIKDGVAQNVSRYSSGLNPRTAIGQRADGAVLLLVIDGRQPHSLGANYQDMIDIMLDYGAVNAATLDGGSSSVMVYENEIITSCSSFYGPGRIPTCFAVSYPEGFDE